MVLLRPCATKSISQKLGTASSQSVNVRMAICCLSQVLGWVSRGPAQRVAAAGGAEQARQRRPACLAHELIDGRRHAELAALDEPVEQLGHEGVKPVGADAAAGLPEHLRRGGDVRPVSSDLRGSLR